MAKVKVKGAPKPGSAAAAAAKARAARNRAAKAKRAKQAKKKKDCKKKLNDSQKAKLRESSPSKAMTAKVNRDSPKPAKCALCGRGAPFAAAKPPKIFPKLSADHIVPVDTIMKKPGFACLSTKNQKKVLNNPKNFAIPGVCPPCNLSRQETKFNKWTGHETFGMTKSGKKYAAELAGKAPGISKSLSSQIGSLL